MYITSKIYRHILTFKKYIFFTLNNVNNQRTNLFDLRGAVFIQNLTAVC